MRLSYSGKGPEARRQHEPDKLKFKPALPSHPAENDDIGCITEARLCVARAWNSYGHGGKRELDQICKSPATGSVTSMGRGDSITR